MGGVRVPTYRNRVVIFFWHVPLVKNINRTPIKKCKTLSALSAVNMLWKVKLYSIQPYLLMQSCHVTVKKLYFILSITLTLWHLHWYWYTDTDTLTMIHWQQYTNTYTDSNAPALIHLQWYTCNDTLTMIHWHYHWDWYTDTNTETDTLTMIPCH